MYRKLTEVPKDEEGDDRNVGLKEAFFGRDYWRATWFGMFLACANISTGINVVNIYTLTIFQTIQKNSGSKDGLTPPQSVTMIGIANFVTAILSFWSSKPFKRRVQYIGGHFCMGIFLLLSGVFISINESGLALASICIFVSFY